LPNTVFGVSTERAIRSLKDGTKRQVVVAGGINRLLAYFIQCCVVRLLRRPVPSVKGEVIDPLNGQDGVGVGVLSQLVWISVAAH
jgi:hypothetical protein